MPFSSVRLSPRFLPISLAVASLFLVALWVSLSGSPACDPEAAEAQLANSVAKGIHGTDHPPSMSKLLWVHVGPRWHTLPLAEKKALDKVVRCAATTIDDKGQPTWQAAYYDKTTGTLVALTSRQYGFRLKNSE